MIFYFCLGLTWWYADCYFFLAPFWRIFTTSPHWVSGTVLFTWLSTPLSWATVWSGTKKFIMWFEMGWNRNIIDIKFHQYLNFAYIFICRIHTWAFSKVTLSIDILSFPIALGVIVFSYTSQIFVCTLEGNMLDRSKFHCMLNWSHIAAAVFKALFGYVGFVTFQEVSYLYIGLKRTT